MRFISICLDGHLVKEVPRSTAEYAAIRSTNLPTHFQIVRRCNDDVPAFVVGMIEGEDRTRQILDNLVAYDGEIHTALLAGLPITDILIHALRATYTHPTA